ncbi:MAG: HEAT repeat domain-containing protein [Polyangiales bacterium]|nr:HEAT repeat domain-containing protein [Myxococcales bacterium]
MTEEDALRFLQLHQPMSDDAELLEDELVTLSSVIEYFTLNPSDEAVPLLLGVFGRGDGFGVYQHVEDALVRQRRGVVVAELARMLGASEGNLFWILQIAAELPDVSFCDGLEQLAAHEDPEVRAMVVVALEAIGDEVSLSVLRARVDAEVDTEVRSLLATAIARSASMAAGDADPSLMPTRR